MTEFADEAVKVCGRLLDTEPLEVGFPGGPSRMSLRLRIPGSSVIVTRRKDPRRAQLELEVLRALHRQGAAVPEILAAEGSWLIQEDLGKRRLSEILSYGSSDAVELWMLRAIKSLSDIHNAGRAAELEQLIAPLGTGEDWMGRLANSPEHLCQLVDAKPPIVNSGAIVRQLTPRQISLVKCDARPGNAIARADGDDAAWFDWEHCGCRHPLDDLAWFLCDEHTPDYPGDESDMLDESTRSFAFGYSPDEAQAYFGCFASLHICMRLALILWNKGQGDWWDPEKCLRYDKVGVTRDAAIRLCHRGARWSAMSVETAPLSAWFHDLSERVSRL